MNKNELEALRISELIVKELESDQRIQTHLKAEALLKEIEKEILNHFQIEKDLTQEVYHMMEDLESQGHQFERHKMFPMLKKQLAKKKGFPL